MASAPQIKALVFLHPTLELFGVRRGADGRALAYGVDLSADPLVRGGVAALAKRTDAIWGPPIWRAKYQTTLLNLRMPVRRADEFLGALVAGKRNQQSASRIAKMRV